MSGDVAERLVEPGDAVRHMSERRGGVSVAGAMEWLSWSDLSPELLYEVLRFRQDIFVVEQHCAYSELDGRDQVARHLLLRIGGTVAGYLRLIPDAGNKQVRIGRVAVAAARTAAAGWPGA